MGIVYSFYTESSDLRLQDDAVIDDDLSQYQNKGGYIRFSAETKNWDNWVENFFAKLSQKSISGKLIIIRESEEGIKRKPLKYIIYPGGIDVFEARITWRKITNGD